MTGFLSTYDALKNKESFKYYAFTYNGNRALIFHD